MQLAVYQVWAILYVGASKERVPPNAMSIDSFLHTFQASSARLCGHSQQPHGLISHPRTDTLDLKAFKCFHELNLDHVLSPFPL